MKLIYPKKFTVKPTELTVEDWHSPATYYKHDNISQGSIEILTAIKYTGPMYIWFNNNKKKERKRVSVYFNWKEKFDPGKTWNEWERESKTYLP